MHAAISFVLAINELATVTICWYCCSVTKYSSAGLATVLYPNDNSIC